MSAHNSLLHMQQRLPAAPSPLIVCDVIGSLCAVQFLICSTFVLVVAVFAVWLEMWFIWFQYKATDYVVKEPGKLELVFTPTGGKEHRMEVFTFKDRGGVGMSMYNTDEVKNFSILLLCHFNAFLMQHIACWQGKCHSNLVCLSVTLVGHVRMAKQIKLVLDWRPLTVYIMLCCKV